MKVAAFEVEEWEKEYYKKNFKADWYFSEKKLTAKDVPKIKDSDVVIVFVNSPVNDEILKGLPKLKAVLTASTGFDHIDLIACDKKNIWACNVPSYGENTVAEQAMALLLSISRKIPQSLERTRKGDFTTDASLRGFDLKGKTMGVIGTGKIGKHVIRMAKGFEMNVIAFDAFKDEKFAKEAGFVYKPLDQVYKEADVLSFHVPYMKETHHMFNMKSLKVLKKGVVVINTARGPVIETDALLDGIKKKVIAFAGLDVLEDEKDMVDEKQLLSKDFQKAKDLKTMLEDHELMDHPNVIVTPHNAFNTIEALTRILDTTIENLKGIQNAQVVNRVVVKK